MAEDADRASLAIKLAAIDREVIFGRQGGVERAAVENAEAPVCAPVKIEVEEVEIGERRHRIERGDEAAIAEHVAHVDHRARDQEIARGHAGIDFDVVDEKLESARLL